MKAVTKKGHREIVECPICRARVAGVIPKGGDGTALRPWKHISALDGYTNPCPGVYELVDFIYHPDLLRKEPQVSGELKPCSICGKPAKQTWDPEENIIKCSDERGYCHNALYGVYYNEWQSRPLEDALAARLESAESALISMVQQYCYRPLDANMNPATDVYHHDFMSAGEEAFQYLVKYGLAKWTDDDNHLIIIQLPPDRS